MSADQPTSTDAQHQPAPVRPISMRRKVLALCVTLVGVLLASVVFFEIAFQLFVPVTDIPFYVWDPVVGPRRGPNQEGRYVYGQQVNARYHFNAQGWNHVDDYVQQKPVGARRVCIVGDSMIEALQVNPEQSMFVHAAAGMSTPDRPVQWYAFGCSGWGTGAEEAAIRHYLLEYQPDVVILMFVQNDPMDCSPYLAKLESFKPRYTLGENHELIREFPGFWKPSPLRRLAAKSALVRYFWIQKRIMDRFRRNRIRQAANAPLRRGAQKSMKASETRDAQKKTWELIEAILAECKRECEARGATFAVAFRGHYKLLDAAVANQEYAPPDREVDPYCFGERVDDMGRDFVGPICKRQQIAYLDLTDALMANMASKGKSHHFSDDVHYNAEAHKVVADALSEWVESLWR